MEFPSEETAKLFNKFVENTKKDLFSSLEANKDRFPCSEKLLNRYTDIAERIQGGSATSIREFHEAQNELCTAVAILEDKSEPRTIKIEYEPINNDCDKRFDFHVTMSKGPVRYIEVKTIHPMSQDDWDKYQSALKKRRFPNNTHLILDNEWLGGELYHNSYAARGKMLDYTIITEDKIEQCLKKKNEKITFLVLFTNGFQWHLDELEDFVFYYYKGIHFPGDPFSKMEAYDVQDREIIFKKTIDSFAYFRRPKLEIRPNKVLWSVALPPMPY
jgi:hypothetical protein